MVSYALMVLFAGGGALKDASGNITDLVIVNGTVTNYTSLADCVFDELNPCKYGLHNSYSVSLDHCLRKYHFVRTTLRNSLWT